VLVMTMHDMASPVSAIVVVIIDFPDDILWGKRHFEKIEAAVQIT
jgi:hypothetical protein